MRTKGYSLFCLFLGIFLVVSLETGLCAESSTYPDRPITVVVPFAPGGTTDVCARIIAEGMEKYLKQPIIVVSKPGAGTTIAGNFVANAKPDGYTIGFLTPSTFSAELYSFLYPVPYSSKDLIPVSGIVEVYQAMMVKGDAPWNSLKDLVEYAQKNPGLKIATLGKAHFSYYLTLIIARQEKIDFTSVPFDGGSKMVPPLLGGHVPVGVTGVDPSIKSLLDAKKLRALAMLNGKRGEIFSEIPSMVELGYKNPFLSITGLFAPKGTSEEVVKRIDEAVHKIIEEKDVRTKIFNTTAELHYLESVSYKKSLITFKEKMHEFFKAEGLVK